MKTHFVYKAHSWNVFSVPPILMSKRTQPEPDPVFHNLADWRPKRRKGGTRSQPLSIPSRVVVEDLTRRGRSAVVVGRSYGPSGPRGRTIRGAVTRTRVRERVQPSSTLPQSAPFPTADFDGFNAIVFEQNLPPIRKRKVLILTC